MINLSELEKKWAPKPYRRNIGNDRGRWHIKLGDRLIRQGKLEQGLREYNKALKLMLRHT